jgi:hypothetical protein
MELSQHELSLLSVAIPYFQEVNGETSRDSLRDVLHCGSHTAQRILDYLLETEAAKVADRLQKLPVTAEAKAHIAYALGDQSGTLVSHVLRENARLQRRAAKKGFETASETEVRAQEIRNEIEALKVIAKEELSKVRKPQGKPSTIRDTALHIKDAGVLCEIACPDLHVGKLAHPAETGRRPYDVKIAIATFNRALDGLLARTSHFDISEFLFVVGNDLCNSDNPQGTTTGGTAVSNDGRFFKTFWKTRTMIVQAIEKLRHIAKVKVLICPGNHDRQTAFHLGDSLECYFHADPLVEVENNPASRKYVEFGNCLLGFCHGDEGRSSEYGLLMAAEQPEAWGRTKYREMHTGHFHRLKTEEYHGVRVRILSALTEADSWHAAQGYIGAIRQAEAFIWSKKEGLLAEVFWNDDAQEPIITRTEIV